MTPVTAGWLSEMLKKVPEDTKVVISISGTYFPLARKIDRVLGIYSTKDNPTVDIGEDLVCFFTVDDLPSKPDLTKDLPSN